MPPRFVVVLGVGGRLRGCVGGLPLCVDRPVAGGHGVRNAGLAAPGYHDLDIALCGRGVLGWRAAVKVMLDGVMRDGAACHCSFSLHSRAGRVSFRYF